VTLPRTPSQTVGPYFAIGLSRRPENVLDDGGIELSGRLLDGAGEPVPDGLVELWDADTRRFGRCATDPEGRFRFKVASDVAVLDAHVFARGLLKHQRTRIYLREVEDRVLDGLEPERRETLLAVPEGDGLRLDVRLQGERESVFFEP